MKRTTILLATLQVRQLQGESKRTGLAIAEIIRRAIDEYLLHRGCERLERALREDIPKDVDALN